MEKKDPNKLGGSHYSLNVGPFYDGHSTGYYVVNVLLLLRHKHALTQKSTSVVTNERKCIWASINVSHLVLERQFGEEDV